jgi:3-oxoacyl-[acyl-carrier protein] reductase
MQAPKRIGRPDDFADMLAFLASDGARRMTGASDPVDGKSKLETAVYSMQSNEQ